MGQGGQGLRRAGAVTGDRITQLGFVIAGNSPDEFAKVVRNEVEKFRKIIIESGIPLL